jgi:hypothetical protein
MALALGVRVTLATSLSPAYDRSALSGLDLVEVAADQNPRYRNVYDAAGDRVQHLDGTGEALDRLPWGDIEPADLLIVAPAFHEFAGIPPVPCSLVSIAFQGLLRRRLADGRVRPVDDPVAATAAFARPGALAFLSDEDVGGAAMFSAALSRLGLTVVLTRGHRGATLYRGGEGESFVAIPPAREVDPTGAGDCFATAFAIRYLEAGSFREAMDFGLAAGSLSVEAAGLAAIPTRQSIEERLAGRAA